MTQMKSPAIATSTQANPSADAPPLPLQIRALSRRFGATTALDGVDLDLGQGSMTVILGAAGAGKTTLLKLIAGLDRPDQGQVILGGQDMTRAEPRARNLAMIFDNLALYPDRSGFDNIAYPLRLARRPPPEITAKVTEMARLLRIPHVLGRLPKTMSGGEKQRVALARALVRAPRVFLLDEPLSSLDAMLRIELRAELRRLQREQGHTFLLATPDYQEALALADRVVMLRAGRVVQIAPPQQLYDHPADLETARFIGAPQINVITALRRAQSQGGGLDLGGHFLPESALVSPDLGPMALARLPPGPVLLALRPEHIGLCPETGAETAAETGAPIPGQACDLQAVLRDIEPLGHQLGLSLAPLTIAADALGGGELRLTLPADHPAARRLEIGQTLGLRLALSRVLAFDPKGGQALNLHEESETNL